MFWLTTDQCVCRDEYGRENVILSDIVLPPGHTLDSGESSWLGSDAWPTHHK